MEESCKTCLIADYLLKATLYITEQALLQLYHLNNNTILQFSKLVFFNAIFATGVCFFTTDPV